jgi:hypothetical protein
MPIANLKNAAVLFLGTVALFPSFHPGGNRGATQNAAPTVVQVDKAPRGVTYKVNSKSTGSTPTTDLLYALNRVREERGSSAPVVVLIDPRVPIDQVWNIDGTAGKAQLTNLRYFVFNRDTEKMSELKWGPSIPLSTNPPVD